MKNDSIAVELRRKGSRIWVCKPSATKCPGIGGKPENDPMSNIDRKADRRSSQNPRGSHRGVSSCKRFVWWRINASQNSTSRSHICDSKKFMWAKLLTYQEAVMIAEAIPFQRCDDFWNLSLYRPTSKLCHLLSCGMPFSKAFAGRPNTGTVFSPRQTPPRSQMGSHDLPSRYLAGVVSKTFLLSVPLFRIEASPRPCLSLTF